MADDKQDCRVYWGHAGCELPRGHDGPHKDLPGHPEFPKPGEGLEHVFGEDWHAVPQDREG